jgi:hypothetical protein
MFNYVLIMFSKLLWRIVLKLTPRSVICIWLNPSPFAQGWYMEISKGENEYITAFLQIQHILNSILYYFHFFII